MQIDKHSTNWFFLPIIICVVIFFWDTPFIYPLKVLVVFFHESAHTLMTIFTGGSVKEMVVSENQGGHVMSAGGSRFLILSAGYLGSLIIGAVIYLMAYKTQWDKFVSAALGTILIIITIVFVRNTFGFIFGLITGGAMIALGYYGTEFMNDLILRVIGVTSMLYVPLDIYSDTIGRSHIQSDASMLAEEFGGTTIMWGGLWFVLSAIILYYVMRPKIRNI